jgi:cell wall-associated NlpC family hydrolase
MRRIVLLAALLAGCVTYLSGCAWHESTVPNPVQRPVPSASHSARPDAVRLQAANTAARMVGVPYRYGGRGPEGFDCSGLVHYAYQQAGIAVPRTSGAQLSASTPIDFPDAGPGDLLFFRHRGKVSHVAIYLGNDQFVHAPSTGKTVTVADMHNPYYREQLIGVGRLYTGD